MEHICVMALVGGQASVNHQNILIILLAIALVLNPVSRYCVLLLYSLP